MDQGVRPWCLQEIGFTVLGLLTFIPGGSPFRAD